MSKEILKFCPILVHNNTVWQ